MINELASVTGVPVKVLTKLKYKEKLCIENEIYNKLLLNETFCSIDIDIGKLCLYWDESGIKYKFIPSDEFEKDLIDIIDKKNSPLSYELEEALTKKLMSAYKDLF